MELSRVTAPEARTLVEREGYTILDVRSTPEFVGEHAAGAYNIPFLHKQPQGMVSNPDFAKVVEAVFPDRATKLVTTCAMGGRSARAAQQLRTMGYTNVVDLRGGFEGERDDGGQVVVQGWKGSGLPTETGESKGRAYVELYAKLTAAPKSVPPPPAPAAAAADPHAGHSHAHGGHGHSHGGHSHGGHSHGGGHGHSHGAPAGGAAAAAAASAGVGGALPLNAALNRFADPNRMVDCVKLGRRLPGIKRRPLGGPLGERVYQTISAEAWLLWVEHSKLIINEYRLNPADAPAQEMLIKQCEAFLFGEGGAVVEKPKEFKPA